MVKPSPTATLPLPGADQLVGVIRPLETLSGRLQGQYKVTEEVAWHLARSYGSDAEDVLAACDAEPDGRTPVLPDLPYLWGELAWLTREEMVLTLTDLCVRRTQLYYLAGERLLTVAPQMAERLGAWCDAPPARRKEWIAELAAFIEARKIRDEAAPDASTPEAKSAHVA